MRRPPRAYHQEGTRWTLQSILAACPWLRITSLGGLSAFLKRLDIRYKRARAHVHSPDQTYVAKLRDIRVHVAQAMATPQRCVVLFQDEFSYTRQPSLSWAYDLAGDDQPLAEQGYQTNRVWRVSATLDGLSGRVVYVQRGHITIPTLVSFYAQVRAAYPQAEEIYLVQDNWPIHVHPDVLAALRPQEIAYRLSRPGNWSTEATKRAKKLDLPIKLLLLPTYASWCNPIEKLWRKLRQEVLHVHRYEDDFDGLRAAVAGWLDQFKTGSSSLLRYVGLSDPRQLYKTVMDLKELSPPLPV